MKDDLLSSFSSFLEMNNASSSSASSKKQQTKTPANGRNVSGHGKRAKRNAPPPSKDSVPKRHKPNGTGSYRNYYRRRDGNTSAADDNRLPLIGGILSNYTRPHVLDIGCNDGSLTMKIAALQECSVVGVDVDVELIRRARRTVRDTITPPKPVPQRRPRTLDVDPTALRKAYISRTQIGANKTSAPVKSGDSHGRVSKRPKSGLAGNATPSRQDVNPSNESSSASITTKEAIASHPKGGSSSANGDGKRGESIEVHGKRTNKSSITNAPPNHAKTADCSVVAKRGDTAAEVTRKPAAAEKVGKTVEPAASKVATVEEKDANHPENDDPEVIFVGNVTRAKNGDAGNTHSSGKAPTRNSAHFGAGINADKQLRLKTDESNTNVTGSTAVVNGSGVSSSAARKMLEIRKRDDAGKETTRGKEKPKEINDDGEQHKGNGVCSKSPGSTGTNSGVKEKETTSTPSGTGNAAVRKVVPSKIETKAEEKKLQFVFPFNVTFRCENVALPESKCSKEVEKYDVIVCLSVTKWVHIAHGDDGIEQLFAVARDSLKVGGCFILEPQMARSYKLARERGQAPKDLDVGKFRLKPSLFRGYLLGKQGGFSRVEILRDVKKGGDFNRQVLAFFKDNNVARDDDGKEKNEKGREGVDGMKSVGGNVETKDIVKACRRSQGSWLGVATDNDAMEIDRAMGAEISPIEDGQEKANVSAVDRVREAKEVGEDFSSGNENGRRDGGVVEDAGAVAVVLKKSEQRPSKGSVEEKCSSTKEKV